MTRGLRWLLAAVVLPLASAGVGTGTRKLAADPLLELPFSAFQTCTYFCETCGEGKHKISQAVKSNASSSHLETCNEGICSWHSCKNAIEPASLGELWVAVREAEGEELEAALERFGEYAYYNAGRDAVQVRGCEGTVLASIPLTDEQVAVLEE